MRKPTFHIPVNPEVRDQELQLSFKGAYRELQLRSFTADILKGANRLRHAREVEHRSEFEDLFVRREVN
jgi:hypothetical protein